MNKKKGFYFDVQSEIAHFRDHLSHAFLDTFLAPPPHTIIGFLGSCCGFTEKETEVILSPNVMVGCKILSVRGYLKDLVIMQNQKVGTYVPFPRTRKFLVNPLYRIYVGANNQKRDEDQEDNNEKSNIISRIRQAVFSPKFTPFLGISDCIAYIRNISDLMDIEPRRFKETESIVPFPIGNARYEKKNWTSIQKPHNISQNHPEYYTRIKDSGVFTVYPHIVIVPRSYEITENGRKPKSLVKLLISLNCIVSFKKAIDGWTMNDENVVLA